jgi:hypothetical protein
MEPSGAFRCLEIAGFRFAIRSDVPLFFSDEPAYAEFFDGTGGAPVHTCDLEVRAGELPDVSHMRAVFSAGRAWTLRVDEQGAPYLVGEGREDEGPRWVARPAPDGAHVDVHCGESRVVQAHGTCALANPVVYPLDQVLLTRLLALRGGLLVHAAGFRVGDMVCVCAGRSGAGKSTLSRFAAEQPGMEVLSDDRVVLRRQADGFGAYGTPWPGEQGAARNAGAALRALCFIEKAERNKLVPLSASEALARLLPVTSVPWFDEPLMSASLATCGEVVSQVSCYALECRADPAAIALVAGLSPS